MPSSKPNKYDANFVSQEQIDTLLKGSEEYVFFDGEDPLGDISDFINTDEIDRLLGDDDPEEEAFIGFHREDEMGDDSLPEEEDFEDEDLSMISMDDIQRVLSEDEGPASEESPLEALDLNLEEMMVTPQEEAMEGEGDLISQEDIDRLLRGSLVDDDEVSDAMDEGFQLSPEEMETLLTDTFEEASEPPDGENLGESGGESFGDSPEEPKGEEGPLPSKKKRWILITALLVLLLLGGGAGGLFFMSDDEEIFPVATLPISGPTGEVGGESTSLGPGEIQVVSRLENFLISAPEDSDYTFVSMHVVITIRGVKSDPIKGYESFYRKRIYDDMTAKIGTLSKEKPVKNELRELVRKTVGAHLAEGVIHGVVLENYRLM